MTTEGTTTTTTPTVYKVLELSILHLPEDLRRLECISPGIYVVDFSDGDWFLEVPADIDATVSEWSQESPRNRRLHDWVERTKFNYGDDFVEGDDFSVPDEIVTIWRYAHKLECDYVKFDTGYYEAGTIVHLCPILVDLPVYADVNDVAGT